MMPKDSWKLGQRVVKEESMNIPRRIDLLRNTPAELAIRHALDQVELMGCHELLTEAVVLLGQAREKVADYVDRLEQPNA